MLEGESTYNMECVYEKNLVEIYCVTPNVYFRKANLNIRRQCNGAYLVSNNIVAAVDVPSMEAAQEMIDESRQLFGQPIRYIFLTHGHVDHVDGLPMFLNQPVTIFCSHRLIGQFAPVGSQHKATFIGVDGSVKLRMGGLEIELFTLPDTAHSPWDMFVRLTHEELLCTGDVAVEFQTLYYHTANVENWIASLRKIAERGGKHILPGHGDVYPYSHLDAVAEFIETVHRAAQYCLGGVSKEEIKDMDGVKINTIISGYLSGSDADALTICEKAGQDAERELRMVFRSLLYKYLR